MKYVTKYVIFILVELLLDNNLESTLPPVVTCVGEVRYTTTARIDMYL